MKLCICQSRRSKSKHKFVIRFACFAAVRIGCFFNFNFFIFYFVLNSVVYCFYLYLFIYIILFYKYSQEEAIATAAAAAAKTEEQSDEKKNHTGYYTTSLIKVACNENHYLDVSLELK